MFVNQVQFTFRKHLSSSDMANLLLIFCFTGNCNPWNFLSYFVFTFFSIIKGPFTMNCLLSFCLCDIPDAATHCFQKSLAHCEGIKNIFFGNNFSNITNFDSSFLDALFENMFKRNLIIIDYLLKASPLHVFNHIAGSNCRCLLIENCIFPLCHSETMTANQLFSLCLIHVPVSLMSYTYELVWDLFSIYLCSTHVSNKNPFGW